MDSQFITTFCQIIIIKWIVNVHQMVSLLKTLGPNVKAATEQCCLRALTHLGYHLQSQVLFFFFQTELPNPQTMRQVWCWKTCTPAHCPKLCSLVEVNRAIKAWSYNWFFRKTGGNLPTQLSASPPAGWRDNASFGRFCWNPGQETHCDHNSRCQVVLEKIISSKI